MCGKNTCFVVSFCGFPFENDIFSGAGDALQIWQLTAKLWLVNMPYTSHHGFEVTWKFQASEKYHVLVQETKWNSSLVGGWTNPFRKI